MLIIMSAVLILGFGASAALKPGDPAPDFRLPDSTGKMHSLSDYRGNIVAIYFYPKNDTPGCTSQACSLRDGFDILKEDGVVVLGISYDDVASHARFKEKYNLNFTLLADTDKKTAKAYDAAGMLFAKRITYIVDADGVIMHVIDSVDTKNHAQQIHDVLKSKAVE